MTMKASRRYSRPRSRLLDPFLWLVAVVAVYLFTRLLISLLDELPKLLELK